MGIIVSITVGIAAMVMITSIMLPDVTTDDVKKIELSEEEALLDKYKERPEVSAFYAKYDDVTASVRYDHLSYFAGSEEDSRIRLNLYLDGNNNWTHMEMYCFNGSQLRHEIAQEDILHYLQNYHCLTSATQQFDIPEPQKYSEEIRLEMIELLENEKIQEFNDLRRNTLENLLQYPEDMPQLNFDGIDLEGVNLEGVNFFMTDLRGANLQNTNLQDAELVFANLKNADIRNANMISVNAGEVNMDGANLEGVTLQGSNLIQANLQNANLKDVNFQSTQLRSTDLRGTDLRSVEFLGATLHGANLQNTNMEDVDLHGINLEKTKLLDTNMNNVKNMSISAEEAKARRAIIE